MSWATVPIFSYFTFSQDFLGVPLHMCGSQVSHMFELNVYRIQGSSFLTLFFPGLLLSTGFCYLAPCCLWLLQARKTEAILLYQHPACCGLRPVLRHLAPLFLLSVADSSPESTYFWSFSSAFRWLFICVVFQSIVLCRRICLIEGYSASVGSRTRIF